MNALQESLYYLVVDVRDDRPILVFLGSDPADNGGPHGVPVQLELMSPFARFGRPGRPSFGRPMLGKARGAANRFCEFGSSDDLWEAGYLPVASYRVCDDWNDYHLPWSGSSPEQRTASAAFDDSI